MKPADNLTRDGDDCFCTSLGGLASRRSSVMPVMIFSQLAGLITLLLVWPFLPPATATRADFAWGALAGGALAMGLMLLYQGLATGKMRVVAPVTAVLAVMCRQRRESCSEIVCH